MPQDSSFADSDSAAAPSNPLIPNPAASKRGLRQPAAKAPGAPVAESRDDRPVEVLRGVVIAVLPAFNQADIACDAGLRLVVTRSTPGIRFEDLRKGQAIRCRVTQRPMRVVSAEMI